MRSCSRRAGSGRKVENSPEYVRVLSMVMCTFAQNDVQMAELVILRMGVPEVGRPIDANASISVSCGGKFLSVLKPGTIYVDCDTQREWCGRTLRVPTSNIEERRADAEGTSALGATPRLWLLSWDGFMVFYPGKVVGDRGENQDEHTRARRW